jgi:exosome complex component CSL4
MKTASEDACKGSRHYPVRKWRELGFFNARKTDTNIGRNRATMSMSDLVLPGQPLPLPKGPVPQLGTGIYSRDGQVRASLVGTPHRDGSTLAITRVRPRPPGPNSVILGTIIRLSPLQATLSITVVDGVPLPPGEEFTGVIRTQDVRATEKDRVKIGDCFRGGDVVRGVVISLGDARSYLVTTARNDLGVIFATSEAGATMEPVSWQEMRCRKTGRVEKRKCAKPDGM